MNGEIMPMIRRSLPFKPIDNSKPQNLVWPANPSYDNPIVAFRYTGGQNINFQLKAGEKTYLSEHNYSFKQHLVPDIFKKVIVGFSSNTDTRFDGIAFYDKQGKELLSLGAIKNPVETILDDDERIVGIASRNDKNAEHNDF